MDKITVFITVVVLIGSAIWAPAIISLFAFLYTGAAPFSEDQIAVSVTVGSCYAMLVWWLLILEVL